MNYIYAVAVLDTEGKYLGSRFMHYNTSIMTHFPSNWTLKFEGQTIISGDTPEDLYMPKNDTSYTVLVNPDSSEIDIELEESYHKEYRQRSGLGYWLCRLSDSTGADWMSNSSEEDQENDVE
jgi:hypothetical protein